MVCYCVMRGEWFMCAKMNYSAIYEEWGACERAVHWRGWAKGKLFFNDQIFYILMNGSADSSATHHLRRADF